MRYDDAIFVQDDNDDPREDPVFLEWMEEQGRLTMERLAEVGEELADAAQLPF